MIFKGSSTAEPAGPSWWSAATGRCTPSSVNCGDAARLPTARSGSSRWAPGTTSRAGSAPAAPEPAEAKLGALLAARIPIDPVAAAKLLVAGTPRPVDLIVDDDGGVVVNAVHVGVGAEAAQAARPLKPWLRVAAFPIGAVLAGATAKGWRLKITVDGNIVADGRRSVLMAGIANARTIAGGTAELGPEASPVDGVADVTVSYAVGPLARIGYALALRRGRHPERADVVHLKGRDVEVSGGPFRVNADGELTGPVTHKRWRIVPHAWRLVLRSMSTVECQGAEPQLAEDFHRNP